MKKSSHLGVLRRCVLVGLGLSLTSLRPALAQIWYPRSISPISIVSPSDRSVFYAPVDIPIFAYARDSLGSVGAVKFYAGTNYLGLGQRLYIATPINPFPLYKFGRDQFSLVWSNAPVGDYALTAVTADFLGRGATSAPVHITIRASSPPATNATDVVSIVASDPVAIVGTNCWRWRGVTNAPSGWTNWPPAAWVWFTNCGPKDAGFAVRRFGDCSQALTVGYRTSGTATNGVQYVALPNSVTIPAGQAYALIPLIPIDDGRPDINRTAILTLTARTNQPPAYLLGWPQAAAALIIDSNQSRPRTAVLPDRSFHVNADGPDGAWFHVEYSTNLLGWTSLCTNQVFNGAIDFVDPDAPAHQSRFYRAVPEANPPVQ